MMDRHSKFINYPGKPPLIEKYFIAHLRSVEQWDEREVEAYTVEALNELLAHVYQNNDYYRAKMQEAGLGPDGLTRLEEFQSMGLTSKDDLRKEAFLILSVPKHEIAQVFLSTGTTGGESIYMMHTWEDQYLRDLGPHMPELVATDGLGLIVNALPYEMSSAGLSFHNVLQHSCSAGVISVGKGGFYSSPQKTLKAMKDLQAGGMFTTPSYAMYLAEVAEELGYRLGEDIRIKRVWLTGEGCSNAFRSRIEKVWHTSAYCYYGSLECGPLGIECDEKRQGYHIPVGHVYIEILDPRTGMPLAPGEVGEVVVTTLLRMGSPLIRFRSGDLGYIDETPCSCGVKLKQLYLRGRVCDQIKIGRMDFSPFYVEELLMRIEEVGNNYRFLVHDDYLEIEVEAEPGCQDRSGLEERIASRVEYGCGLPCRARIVEKISYDGGKAQRVIFRQTMR